MDLTVSRNKVVHPAYTIIDQALEGRGVGDRGEEVLFRATRIENGKLTVDANRPLAGQTVKFNATVVAHALKILKKQQVSNFLGGRSALLARNCVAPVTV